MEVMALALQLVISDHKAIWVLALERIIHLVTRSNNKGNWAGELGSTQDSDNNLVCPWSSLSSLGLTSL